MLSIEFGPHQYQSEMRNPKTLGLLRGSKITLEAHIKMNTPIPFCQFEGSPCKEAWHVYRVTHQDGKNL